MKKKLNLISLLLIVLVIILEGCVPAKQPTVERKVLPADRLLKKIEANRRKIKFFKGTGKIEINTPDLEAIGSFEIEIKKPDSIKFSIYGPFGIDLAHTVVSRNDVVFYEPNANVAYIGPIRPELLKKVFKVNLNFNELIDAFAGAVNLTERLSQIPDDFQINKDDYLLTYFDKKANKEYRYLVNIADHALLDYKIIEDQKKIMFEGRYTHYKNIDNVPIPYKTKIRNRTENQELVINYRNIEVNEEIGNLKLNLPDDVKIIRW